MRARFAFAAATLLVAVPALAQQDPGEEPVKEPRVVYAKETTIDLDGVSFDVEMKRPAGIIMIGHGDQKFPSIIEERVHFKRDLAKSIKLPIAKRAAESETAPK